jgi:hypothetical protein
MEGTSSADRTQKIRRLAQMVENTERKVQGSKAGDVKEYVSPRLEVYGRVRELTTSGGSASTVDIQTFMMTP